VVQPFIDAVREPYAKFVGRALLVEYQSLATTGTPQITTVIYREPQVLYAIRLAMQYSVGLYVGTLIGVAVPVGAVRD